MIIKYKDNDSYSSPVAPNNSTVTLNNGRIAQKMCADVWQIFTIVHPLFGVTNRPLHPFLAPKSPVLGH